MRIILFVVFLTGTAGGAIAGLLWAHSPIVSSASAVIVAICSGGLTSSVFEYATTARAIKKKKSHIKNMTILRYGIIKEELAYEIICASIKFGRTDLREELGRIGQLCDPINFRRLFRRGRQATEGFYAFANAMSFDKYHHDRILLNLLRISDLFESASMHLQDENNKIFDIAQMIKTRTRRILTEEDTDEIGNTISGTIWKIFCAWDPIQGDLDKDPILSDLDDI